jgi:putative ABC transport system permease protein
LREEVRALDADLPLFDIRTFDEWLAFFRWPQRVFGTMFSIFAAIGLILSAVGVYAVIAYSVSQRAQEIGVRMALGARSWQVTWLVVRRAVVQLSIGLALGLPLAVGVGQILPFGSRDLLTLVPITVVLLAVALVACIVPARRAARLDPVTALRHE